MHTRTVFILVFILSKKGSSRTKSTLPSRRDSSDRGEPSCSNGKARWVEAGVEQSVWLVQEAWRAGTCMHAGCLHC
jgi:hypothetical protein